MTGLSLDDAKIDTSDQTLEGALKRLLTTRSPVAFVPDGVASIVERLQDAWRLVNVFGVAADPALPAFLSRQFLDIAKKGVNDVAAATLGLNVHQPDGVSWRSKSIARAARQGFATMLCPFSGEPRRVDHSLGRDWFFVGKDDEICLASDIGSVMVDVGLESVWVFPGARLILRINSSLDDEVILREVANLFFHILTCQNEVAAYLERPLDKDGDGVSVTDFPCPHMAHNLWNIQTAWFNVFEMVPPSRFKSIVNFRHQNFFGSLEELYPEAMSQAPAVVSVSSEKELFLHSLKTGGVMLCVKDEMFRPGFSAVLLKWARAQCSPEFLGEVAALRAACHPLVVTTIRLDNREWIEQREGFPQLFSALHKDFPGIGFILDGLSTDTAKGWTTGWMSMEAELGVARFIREQSPQDLPISFAVGRKFCEALVLCDAADCFIAPSGSGMALYKWISNMPGLAFSNRAALERDNFQHWPLRVWHAGRYRHDITPTVHLPPALVEDDASKRDDVTRSNFHLDWRMLHREALQFLRESLSPPKETKIADPGK